MALSNPLRGQYLLQGLDFVRAGIVKGSFVREDTGAIIHSDVPAMERWVSSRAVTAAASKAGLPLDMAALPANVILPLMQQDSRFKVWTTEERIVALLGGESPDNRAFAQAELDKLNTTYGAVAKAA
jgi:hypothetical protein